MFIISNLGLIPVLKAFKVFNDLSSDVTKCVTLLSRSACENNFESFGIIALGRSLSLAVLL